MAGSRKRFGALKQATNRNIENLPDDPGVYGLFSKAGTLMYAGKAKRFRADDRVMEHKDEGRIPFKKVGFIPATSQEAALKLEKQIIKSRKPRFNKSGK
ncbi:MAG: hypothetical protein WD509_01775 [Candidatus Paceibacterota bacterium]